MLKIGVSSELEKLIRGARATGLGRDKAFDSLIELLDEARANIGKKVLNVPGLSYKELLFFFRDSLGDTLAVPPRPTTGWIIRIVNRAKELGLDAESIKQLCVGVRKQYPRGPYDLEFLIRGATRFIAGANTEGEGRGTTIFTGRTDDV